VAFRASPENDEAGSRDPASCPVLPGSPTNQSARPANSPVVVFTSTFSPVPMYSGTMISIPVESLAGLGRLVAVPPLSSGRRLDDFDRHVLRQLQRDRAGRR
jgi:hypothetical protein